MMVPQIVETKTGVTHFSDDPFETIIDRPVKSRSLVLLVNTKLVSTYAKAENRI